MGSDLLRSLCMKSAKVIYFCLWVQKTAVVREADTRGFSNLEEKVGASTGNLLASKGRRRSSTVSQTLL